MSSFQVKARSKSWWQTKFYFFLNTSDLEKLKSWLQGWKAKTWEENRIIRLVVPPTEEALRHIVHGIREKYSLTSAQTSARQMVDLPNIQNVTSLSPISCSTFRPAFFNQLKSLDALLPNLVSHLLISFAVVWCNCQITRATSKKQNQKEEWSHMTLVQ